MSLVLAAAVCCVLGLPGSRTGRPLGRCGDGEASRTGAESGVGVALGFDDWVLCASSKRWVLFLGGNILYEHCEGLSSALSGHVMNGCDVRPPRGAASLYLLAEHASCGSMAMASSSRVKMQQRRGEAAMTVRCSITARLYTAEHSKTRQATHACKTSLGDRTQATMEVQRREVPHHKSATASCAPLRACRTCTERRQVAYLSAAKIR